MGTTMERFQEILARASAAPRVLGCDELTVLLAAEGADFVRLCEAAYAVKKRVCGLGVAVRGLVEAGNGCAKNCFYCGIRHDNARVARYQLTADEIYQAALVARDLDYASLVIQSGELEGEAHTAFIEDVLHRLAPLQLGITLSLGEQTEDTYRRWRAAGAVRYLLRIETSNRTLYRALHPADHSWEYRVGCLEALRRCDYQVGTGVMCGLPGQTLSDLAADIAFYAEQDVDMIGMGPFISHPDTPLAHVATSSPAALLRLALKMIAVTRLHLHDVNIAATTALQTLASDGREQGIRAGANVLMPNVTDVHYRPSYQLYAGKPTLDETAQHLRHRLAENLAAFGEHLVFNARCDSRHYAARKGR